MVAASRMDGRDMVRQRASAGGRRNVVQTAHDLRRISLLTDTSLVRFRLWRKRAFVNALSSRHAFIEKSERKYPDNSADNTAGNALYSPISAADCGERKGLAEKNTPDNG